MSAMPSQITSLTIVYLTVCSGVDQRKHQSSMSLAFVRGIHRWPVNSPHKGPVTWKIFTFDDVIIAIWMWWKFRLALIQILMKCLLQIFGHHARVTGRPSRWGKSLGVSCNAPYDAQLILIEYFVLILHLALQQKFRLDSNKSVHRITTGKCHWLHLVVCKATNALKLYFLSALYQTRWLTTPYIPTWENMTPP